MKIRAEIDFSDLRGGVNAEVASSVLAQAAGVGQTAFSPKPSSQAPMAVNFKPRNPGVIQRGGLRLLFQFLAPNGAEETVLGLAMQLRGDERGLVVLGQHNASWFRLNYGLEIPMGELSTSSSQDPWSVTSWNNSLFIARPADGLKVLEFAPEIIDDAGHVAPVAVLNTVETADAGPQTSGTSYTYVYAFRDTRTGYTSNHSEPSESLLSTGMSVTVSGFEAVPNARFDKYVIYRSLPDGTSEWLEIAEIDSDETSYVDAIPIEQQGAAADEHNDVPVDDVRSVIAFQSRLWIHDGRLVYPSGILNPEAFPVDEALEIGQRDSEEIIEFCAGRDRILVGKRNSIWSITGTGATSWEIKLVDGQHGCIKRQSMFEQDGLFVWASDDDFYASDGQSPGQPLSTAGKAKLRPYFKARNVADPIIAVSIPGSQGALLGLRSLVRLSDVEE